MSLEQALRYGAGDLGGDLHRGFYDQRTQALMNGNDQYAMNLNLLLFAEEGRQQPSPFHQSPHLNQSLGFSPSLRQSPGFSQQGAFLNQTSPFQNHLPLAPPNSAFRSSPLTPFREQAPAHQPSARVNLFPEQQQQLPSSTTKTSSPLLGDSNPAPPSSLGLQDILQRLDSLSKDLPTTREANLTQTSLAQPLLPQVSSSRDSTPLSWNPLCSLSPTPLSLTPSPTLAQPALAAPAQPAQVLPPNPAPVVRPLMEQKVEAPEEELKRMKLKSDLDDEACRRRREEVRRVNPDMGRSPRPRQMEVNAPTTAVRGIAKLGPKSTSWSQIVRTSSTGRLPTANLPSPTVLSPSPSPPSPTAAPAQLPDYHRGPKVDPRWPVQQQVFLGPIPMAISWDEIRNVFYTKVSRKELIHFYVQSKPVNEVVYGQVVFDKVSLANKIIKEGEIKVRGHSITLTAMAEKMKQMKLEKKK